MKKSAMTIRLEDNLHHEFMAYCKNNDVPASMIIRRLMKSFLAEKKANIPVSNNVPNAETLQSMTDTANGVGVKSYSQIDELFDDLGI